MLVVCILTRPPSHFSFGLIFSRVDFGKGADPRSRSCYIGSTGTKYTCFSFGSTEVHSLAHTPPAWLMLACRVSLQVVQRSDENDATGLDLAEHPQMLYQPSHSNCRPRPRLPLKGCLVDPVREFERECAPTYAHASRPPTRRV